MVSNWFDNHHFLFWYVLIYFLFGIARLFFSNPCPQYFQNTSEVYEQLVMSCDLETLDSAHSTLLQLQTSQEAIGKNQLQTLQEAIGKNQLFGHQKSGETLGVPSTRK